MRIGPSFASVPLAKPFVNALATKAAPRVPIIRFLLLITLDSNDVNAPLRSPLNAVCIALAAPLDCAKDKAVPNSIAETLKLFFALLRGAFLLATITD